MELRAQLVEAGHTFSTDHSDTEVLLHGYEEWGEGMLAKLRGMFAFAIWNEAEQTLFAPVTTSASSPSTTISPMRASCSSAARSRAFWPIPASKGAEPEPAGAVSQLSVFPGEDTFFKGVKKLLPAHSLLWKAGQVDVKRYGSPRFEPEQGSSDWESRVEEVMRQSVAAHKISDVEVGSFLSSGVDSSYMAYLAHVDKTFTVGFANKQYDETDDAAEFSKFMGVKNYAYRIEPEEYWRNAD